MSDIEYYGAYYLGALMAVKKFTERYGKPCRGDDRIYREAEIRLITHNKRSMELWLSGLYEIHYKDHIRTDRGELYICTAYFADRNGREVRL